MVRLDADLPGKDIVMCKRMISVCLAVAVVLSLAAPAAAAVPQNHGPGHQDGGTLWGWVWAQLGVVLDLGEERSSGMEPGGAAAGDEGERGPNINPDGFGSPPPADGDRGPGIEPDGFGSPPPTDGERGPDIDPDGFASDRGPNIDPDGGKTGGSSLIG